MTWFADGHGCTYFRVTKPQRLIAAGWLEGFMEYPCGAVSTEDRHALRQTARLTRGFQPGLFAGKHECSLCHATNGSYNLFVPDVDRLWAAPELVVHYVEDHGYRPPAEFMKALRAAVDLEPQAYIATCGALWAEITMLPEDHVAVDRGLDIPCPPFVHLLVRLTGGSGADVTRLTEGSHLVAELPEGPVSVLVTEARAEVRGPLSPGFRVEDSTVGSAISLGSPARIEIGGERYVYLCASSWRL